MPRPLTGPARRRVPLLLALALTALSFAVPATGHAAVRVGPNFELVPHPNPVYGRDGVGFAVNPRNPRHLVATYADWVSQWCETAVSFNRGRTWRRHRLRPPAGFISPPCAVGAHLAAHIDGGVAFGRGNNVYATFSSARLDEAGEEQGKSVLVAKSTNGGRSFRVAREVLPGGPPAGAEGASGPDNVLPKLTVEPGRRGRSSDRVYLVAGSTETTHDGVPDEDTVFTSSSDGGRTWSTPRNVNAADENAIEQSFVVRGRGQAIFVAYRRREPDPGRPGRFLPQGTVVVAKSTDRGGTWRRIDVARVEGYVHEGPPQPPFAAGQSFTASTFPRLAADRRTGNVYVVYGNGRRPTRPGSATAADHFIHFDMDVWFQRSTDAGRTWSDPRRLNRPSEVQTESVTQTRHPNVYVAPKGRVDVMWQDRRHWYRGCVHTHNACDEARLGDTYYSYSRDAGRSFARERRITDRSINNDVGFDYRFGTYWDYGPVAAHFGPNRLLVAWMDSRIGNVETDNQGIFLARVRHDASRRRIPVRPIRREQGRDVAIALSRLAYPGGPEAVLGGTFASRPWSRVVLVNEADAPGALVAGVLARAKLSSVLVTPHGGLTDEVQAEVARLAPIGAFLIGGQGSLSDQVAADVAETGVPAESITRIAGVDGAQTAELVAKALDKRTQAEKDAGEAAFDAAVIVNPASPDAFTAAALAANRRLPVLFASRHSLPRSTGEALRDLNIPRTLVIGGRRWIDTDVTDKLPLPQRLGGRNAAGTSRRVIREARRRGLPDNILYVTDGERTMDLALMGSSVGRMGGLQLVAADRDDLFDAVRGLRLGGRLDRIVIVERR